jgi:branched-chain amino acid transport system permease protein
MGHYRLFIIALCAALTVALQAVLTRTRFGSRLRAAVDDPRVAAGLGINVNQVFLLTFAVGSAWPAWAALWGRGAGAGAELSAQVHDLLLIVVAVGGTSSITGPLLAALLLGVADVAGKYYIPSSAPSSSTPS